MSPKATPSSQPPASTTTSEMSPKVTPSSHPSSSTIAPPPVTEEVGSGPPVAAIGGAVGAVVVLAIIGVVFLIVMGAVCVVWKKKYTVSKPALYDMPPDVYYTLGECLAPGLTNNLSHQHNKMYVCKYIQMSLILYYR